MWTIKIIIKIIKIVINYYVER